MESSPARGTREKIIWEFQEERVLSSQMTLGIVYHPTDRTEHLCTVMKVAFLHRNRMNASKICPNGLFLNAMGILEDKRVVYPRFEQTLESYMKEKLDECFKDYFNNDMSFSEDFSEILRCCFEAIKWVHDSGKYLGHLNINSVALYKCNNKLSASVLGCELKSHVKIETVRERQKVQLMQFLQQIRRSLDKYVFILNEDSEISHFFSLSKSSFTTCELLLEHSALWSHDRRLNKILLAQDVHVLPTAHLARSFWTSFFRDPIIQHHLCGNNAWNYSNSTIDLLRLFRNVHMHSGDNKFIEANRRFDRSARHSSNMNVTLKSVIENKSELPPLHIIMRSIIPEFYYNLSMFLLQHR